MTSEFKHKENTGSLFINDKRETDSHPNAKGGAVIGGVAYFVSAWTNTDRNGNKYQFLKFQRKDEAHSQGMKQTQAALEPDGFEDPIPF